LAGRSYKVVGNIPFYITGRLFRVLGDLRWKPELTVLTIQKEVAERVCAAPPKMSILSACVQFWAEPTIVGFVPRGDFSPKPKVEGGVIRMKLKVVSCKLKKKKEERKDEESQKVEGLKSIAPTTRIGNDTNIRMSTNDTNKDQESREVEKLKNITPTTRTGAMNANEEGKEKEDEESYYRLVRGLFKQPRKTILNNFQFSNENITPTMRTYANNANKKRRGGAREVLESAGIRPEDRPQNLSVQDILRLQKAIQIYE
jgi:16S rRNA A1518/A1519 N6-dimethyltransferase RsmA/KsgA/DIM1 with predicted DNA glycosylase/AP lyase activity